MENKIGLTGCKWSSLNAPGTETPIDTLNFEKSRLFQDKVGPTYILKVPWGSPYAFIAMAKRAQISREVPATAKQGSRQYFTRQ